MVGVEAVLRTESCVLVANAQRASNSEAAVAARSDWVGVGYSAGLRAHDSAPGGLGVLTEHGPAPADDSTQAALGEQHCSLDARTANWLLAELPHDSSESCRACQFVLRAQCRGR